MPRDDVYLLNWEINLNIVWDIVERELPALIAALELLIPPEEA